ncbi:MAG TPA: pilus assembly protein TadG-related protein [Kineosporiaceae bacterium]|nr:pilus assembly protein TadG-related protein [Kineosporiaceae bacterium]
MSGCKRGSSGQAIAAGDAGVIAIVVALSVSTFVLGFAALAVDLGSAYVRKAELQSIANRLALAGARGLPTVLQSGGAVQQIDQALSNICQDDAVPGVCVIASDGTGSAPDPSWMTDRNPDNGEVSFFSDPDGDAKYRLANRVTDLAASGLATALQVKLPPSTVTFGLAAAFGTDSATLTKSATSRVGTPLGNGILPFALRPTDLTNGQFCVRNSALALDPAPPPAAPRRRPVRLSFPLDPGDRPQFPDLIPAETDDLFIRIQLTARGDLDAVKFHFTNDQKVQDGEPLGDDLYRVPLPRGEAGSTAQVWATGTVRGFGNTTPFATGPGNTIFYTGDPPPADLCDQPSAVRGFAQVARPSGGTVLEDLEQNIRSGPAVNLLPDGGLLESIGNALDCVSTTFAPATTCLSLTSEEEFNEELTQGLLGASGSTPGRLIGSCGNGTTSSDNAHGIDDSDLFGDPGFIDPSKGGSASALQDRLTGVSGLPTAGPENRGWVTSKVLRCPRLAVLPVIDPDSTIGEIGGKKITSFTYVWIDDAGTTSDRGLHWTRGLLDGFRGYVVDPGYLPAVVAGAKLVGPYLGGDMPKQVLLVPDLGGPAS